VCIRVLNKEEIIDLCLKLALENIELRKTIMELIEKENNKK
jgi:hypothetical protein